MPGLSLAYGLSPSPGLSRGNGLGPRFFLGPNLVPNGTFNSASGWTLGTGWSIAGGLLVATAAAIGQNATRQIAVISGRTYRMRLTCVTRTTNNFSMFCGVQGAFRSTTGTFEEDFTVAESVVSVGVVPRTGALTATFDDMSLQEIIRL